MGKDTRVPTTELDLIRQRLDHHDRQLTLRTQAGRSPTVPIYDPEMPLDAVDGQIALKTDTIPYVPPTRTPYYFEAGEWHPFVHFPSGLLAGFGGVDLAVTNPGGLMFRYKLGETTGDALDSSGWPGGPHPLTYVENTAGTSGGETWDPSHEVTRHELDHTEFADGDDGCVKFNYKQLSQSSTYIDFPGARFTGSLGSISQFGTLTNDLKSISVFFKPTAGGIVKGCICGTAFTGFIAGFENWQFSYDPGTNTLTFEGHDGGSGVWNVSLSPPGALTPGQWYHAVVTWDGALYTMYLNGVVVATQASARSTSSGAASAFQIGHSDCCRGVSQGDGYFYGEVDEIDGYRVVLTLADVQAIFAARGAGFGTTVETVHVGTGDPGTDPAAIDSTGAAQYDVVTAKGDGTTDFERSRFKVLHNGV